MASDKGSQPVDSFSNKVVDRLEKRNEELEDKLKKTSKELSDLLQNYLKNSESLTESLEVNKKLEANQFKIECLLETKNKECEELRKKLAESNKEVNCLKGVLNEKCTLIKNQGEKISELEEDVIGKNIEINDLKHTCDLRISERDNFEEELRNLISKMDWILECLNEERYPENELTGINEHEEKLNLIFKLTKEKSRKWKLAFEELEVKAFHSLKKFKEHVSNEMRNIFGEEENRLNQLSKLTTRRRYADVTSTNINGFRRSDEGTFYVSPLSSINSTIPVPIDNVSENTLTEDQFPVPILATTTSPIQSPSSQDSEHDNADENIDIITEEISKNQKSTDEKKKKEKIVNELANGFSCKHCNAKFRVPGVLYQHMTAKHSGSHSKKAVKRKLSLPPPPPPKESGSEHSKKSKTIGCRCSLCEMEFPTVAQLRMHVRKKHKNEHTFFGDVFIPLDHCDMNKITRDVSRYAVEAVRTSYSPPPSLLACDQEEDNSTVNGHHNDDQSSDPPVLPVSVAENRQENRGEIEREVVHEESSADNRLCKCNKRFKKNSHLKNHITQMNRKTFECASCPSKFASLHQLEVHFQASRHGKAFTANLSGNRDDHDDNMMDVSNGGDMNHDHVPLPPQEPGPSTKSNGNNINDHDDSGDQNDSENNDQKMMNGSECITVTHDGDNGADENNLGPTNNEGGTGNGVEGGNNENGGREDVNDVECHPTPERNKLKCCWCPLTFSVESAAQAHAKSVHQGELAIAVKAENGGNFACQTCFQTFETEEELQEHLNTKHLANV